MRNFVVLIMMGISSQVLAQSDENLKIESFQLIYGVELMHHGNQVFNRFTNTVDDQAFFTQSNVAYGGYNYHPTWYSNPTFNAELTLRNGDSKWRYNLGISYFERTNRRYRFRNTEEFVLDTVYVPVPESYYDYNTGETHYYVAYDSLLLDSAVLHEIDIHSYSRNIAVYGEVLRDFKKNKWTISVGAGCSVGMSFSNDVTSRYLTNQGIWMVKPEDFPNNVGVWYADIPNYQPVAGSLLYGPWSYADAEYRSTKGNAVFNLKPYVPLRFDAQIAENGFFSHLAAVGSLNAGMEFQVVKNDGISSRFFWNYKIGLKYVI